MLLVMIPVGMVAGLVLARVHLYLVPRVYESEAILQFKQIVESSRPEEMIKPAATPQFMMGAEFEPFRSRMILLIVSEKLKLEASWGVDEETVLARLKDAVQVKDIRGTDLKSVKVISTDPVEARDIARELVKTYMEWRTKMVIESYDSMLADLRRAVQKQEDDLEQARIELGRIMKIKGSDVSDNDSDVVAAKRNFEHNSDIFKQMKLKLVNVAIKNATIEDRVVIVDHPALPNKPIGFSDRLITLIWMVGGGLFAPILALPIIAFLNRRRRTELG